MVYQAPATGHSAPGRAPQQSCEALAERIRRGEGGYQVRTAYAEALLANGATADALITAKETVLLYPDAIEAHICLGEAFRINEQLPEAINEFRLAQERAPDDHRISFLIGCAWLDAGEPKRALEHFAAAPPGTPGLMAKAAAAEEMQTRPRSDPAYVRHLFNHFSADYDVHMTTRLHYSAPRILRSLYDSLPRRIPDRLMILDLGCGTGLAGDAFHDLADKMIGVDLSAGMIEKARVRAIYDGFDIADIEAPPKAENAFDLVLAADSLVYIGDLGKVFATARTALKPGGIFLFTVEKKPGAGFDLGPKRRWRHSDRYIRSCSGVSGFALMRLSECTLRQERGIAVTGLAAAMKKL